ncbi:MAG: ribose 5-phosphate isomerase B [Candidatus Sericytochromatia bacterium]|nr:ribose 5-phosphate isomerase B [Candidatus Sericytochromatia bacterium]
MRIALAADHGGYALKEYLKSLLVSWGHEPIDMGTHSAAAVDYPDFALLGAAAVAQGQTERAILLDGAGIGSAVVANKLPGVRAGCCNDLFSARNARAHNDTNVLTLGARVIGEGLASEIVKVWLETAFETRHLPRIDKIVKLEQQLFGGALKG